MFVGLKTNVDLSLTSPSENCSNCGVQRPVEMVVTPLQRTKFFLFFGTELTINATFPYCKQCKGSARRTRLGWTSKILTACITILIIFLVLIFSADSLPQFVVENMFCSSIMIGVFCILIYFYFQEWRRKERTYYQPVSLVGVNINHDRINCLILKFYNAKYAEIFIAANDNLVTSGMLQVEVAGEDYD